MALSRWVDRAGFASTAVSILVSGFLHGLSVLSVRIEIASVVVVVVLFHAILSSIAVTVFVGVSGLLFGLKLLVDHRSRDVQVDGDRVAAIVPVYRDAEALDRSVRSLLASSYQNLSVYIVCEPDDRASRQRAEALAQHDQVEVLVNSATPGSKASAIDRAVEYTTGRYVAVFDADERVDPEFVGHAVAKLEDYDVVQSRTVPEPKGPIEAVAYYESVLLSYLSRRLLYLGTGFRMASSRAIVMCRTAYECVGGYDSAMLTEDFEFAYRCYKNRVSVLETLGHPSRIEAAHSVRDWWGQRKRWMTGYAQVFHRLVGDLDPRDHRSVLSILICASTVVGNAVMISLLSKFLVLLILGAEAWFLLPLCTVFAVTVALRLYDAQTIDLTYPGIYWLLTPALFPLYGLTMIKAVFEYLLSWDGEWYSVEKS